MGTTIIRSNPFIPITCWLHPGFEMKLHLNGTIDCFHEWWSYTEMVLFLKARETERERERVTESETRLEKETKTRERRGEWDEICVYIMECTTILYCLWHTYEMLHLYHRHCMLYVNIAYMWYELYTHYISYIIVSNIHIHIYYMYIYIYIKSYGHILHVYINIYIAYVTRLSNIYAVWVIYFAYLWL